MSHDVVEIDPEEEVSTNAPVARPVNKRNLDTALKHARMLEIRKRIEREILDSVEILISFPSSTDADPKRPSAHDAAQFCKLVKDFQPSDFQELIEERNISGQCGYALCPRPKSKAPSTAKKQCVWTDNGPEIVDRKMLEIWCSKDCTRRALYVQAQLNQTPAWLRQGGIDDEIELMVDKAEERPQIVLPLRPKEVAPQPAKQEAPANDADDIAAAWLARDDALAALAMERGEKPGPLSRDDEDNEHLVTNTIKERVGNSEPPVAPSLARDAQSHLAIEGHVPRSDRKAAKDGDGDSENSEGEESDWDLDLS
ncbi:hypothetical protein EJ04DRAFT_514968 [Polyplosphaeria fusca]|uniref:RNA polymerase II subunit B1 CTD phosphatase RPAP2 homolog n=1 Tax=Polyplosphaeria fusca TaxID=682080 RepID=A0A9P4QSI6_9PLEO|nr:hypothetical protein EJ04DRAFT_514968 [Polyplosphaeria fusca]